MSSTAGREHADRRTAQAAAARKPVNRAKQAKKGLGKGGRSAWRREV